MLLTVDDARRQQTSGSHWYTRLSENNSHSELSFKRVNRSSDNRESYQSEEMDLLTISQGRGSSGRSLSALQATRADFVRLKDGNLFKTQKRYDEKVSNIQEEQEAFLENTTPKEESSKTDFLKYYVLKKAFRFFILVIIGLIFLATRALMGSLMRVNFIHEVPGTSHGVEINLTNCYIYLSNSGESGLKFELEARENIFTPSIIFDKKKVTYGTKREGDLTKFDLNHPYKDYTCALNVSWPAGVPLQTLNITCEECTVVGHQKVSIDKLYLYGNNLNLNLKELAGGSIFTSVHTGFFQFNEASITSDSTLNVTNGTIRFQTRQDTTVDLLSFTEGYCFGAPSVQETTAVTCTNTSLSDITTELTLNISSYSKCTGVVNLCGTAGCSPTVKVSLIGITASGYINQLDDASSDLVSSSVSLLSSSIFQSAINLSPQELEIFKGVLLKADKPTTMPLVLKIDIGNWKGESSASTKWIITEYPLTSVYDPWTIAGITFGIFTSNYRELNFYLSPGFCPYRPSLNRKQYAAIKTLLASIANDCLGDTVYTGVVLETDDPFLTGSTNDQFTKSEGFFKADYNGLPEIYDIEAKYGSNIEEAVFSPTTREYNNLNISSYISKQ